MIQTGPAMPGLSRLLSARPALLTGSIATQRRAAALALAPKQLLLQIPVPSPQSLNLFLQDRFPLNRATMLCLPKMQVRPKPDQIFFGNVSANR